MQPLILAYYFFAGITLFSALLVVLSRNPVHSVLWLILTFFGASGLFILLGAEFLALILMIVYVGAVAVLFMFVVMMLNINFKEIYTWLEHVRYFQPYQACSFREIAELTLNCHFLNWTKGADLNFENSLLFFYFLWREAENENFSFIFGRPR